VADAAELIEALRDLDGQTFDIELVREKKRQTLRVTLPEREEETPATGPQAWLVRPPVPPQAPAPALPPPRLAPAAIMPPAPAPAAPDAGWTPPAPVAPPAPPAPPPPRGRLV
jgi:hypothetical protein